MSDYQIVIIGPCVEVTSLRPGDNGKTLGHAIPTSLGWEAWAVSPYDCKSMRLLHAGLINGNDAAKSIAEFGLSYGMKRVPA